MPKMSEKGSKTFWLLWWVFTGPEGPLFLLCAFELKQWGENIKKVEHLSFAAVHQKIGPTCWEAVLLGNSVLDWNWLWDFFKWAVWQFQSESVRSIEDSALCQKQRQDIILCWFLCTLLPSFGSDGAIKGLVSSTGPTCVPSEPLMWHFQPVESQSWPNDHT